MNDYDFRSIVLKFDMKVSQMPRVSHGETLMRESYSSEKNLDVIIWTLTAATATNGAGAFTSVGR